MAISETKEAVACFLAEEGYRPKVDEDGDVVFKSEGRTLVVFHEEDDATFYRVCCPCFWEVDDDEEEERAFRAAHEVGRDLKLVKIYILEGYVWSAVEVVSDTVESFLKVLPRLIHAVQAGVRLFVDTMMADEEPS